MATTITEHYYYSKFYQNDSPYNNFITFTFYKNGSLDYKLIAKVGMIIGAEVAEVIAISYLTGGLGLPAKFGIWAGANMLTGAIKDFFYSDITTQHMSPNAINNFNILWSDQVKCKNVSKEDREILSNFCGESASACYQFGLVSRGTIGSVTKFIAATYQIKNGNFGEALTYAGYILSSGYLSYNLGEKIRIRHEEIKTIENKIKTNPFISSDSKEIIENANTLLEKQQKLEYEMQFYKTYLSFVTNGHEILTLRKGASVAKIYFSEYFGTSKENNSNVQQDAENFRAKFTEASYIIQWGNANMFRLIDVQHRIASMNKQFLNLIKTQRNCDDNLQDNESNEPINSDIDFHIAGSTLNTTDEL